MWAASSLRHHLLAAGDEIGREVAPVGLHPLDDVESSVSAVLASSTVITPFVADLLRRVGDDLADRLVAVGRDCTDLGDLVGGLHLPGMASDVFDDGGHRDVDLSSRWDARRRRRAGC
jgi:hypothetical protein